MNLKSRIYYKIFPTVRVLILAIDTDSIAAWQIISKTQEDIASE